MASSTVPEPALPPIAPPRLTMEGRAVMAWMLCCAVMLWLFRDGLPSLAFHDPDDAMRLQQVRDWLGGQAFFDVSQHRVNPPAGGPMHWSRIVDMPIAALILFFRSLLGAGQAEVIACTLVPLLLLAALAGTLFLAVGRLSGKVHGLLATVLLLTTPPVLVQFTPLRIDHHGWQIWMAALALCGLMDPRPVRGGLVAGMAMGVWLQISSEGLPYAAMIAAVLALWQVFDRAMAPRFCAFAVTLGGGALLLLSGLRGPSAALMRQCDSLSAAYIWPIALFALVTPVAFRLMGTATMQRRLAIAAMGGTAALALFLFTGGPCLSGDPFKSLGPIAYRLWYLQVMEGRPVWEQSLSMRGIILLPPVIGIAATIMAARAATERRERDRWLVILMLLAGSLAIAVLVMRALSVAYILALPGIAWLLLAIFTRIQQWNSPILRVIASVAAMLLTPVGLCSGWIAITPSGKDSQPPAVNCRSSAILAPLRRLPQAMLFAPVDLGPDILVQTGHDVTGTAHHRNAAGITAVIEGFIAPPDQARTIIGRLHGGRGADYVVSCRGLNEFDQYASGYPNGLAAMLARNAPPAWLRELPMTRKGPLHIYRIAAQPGTKASATPFMQ